MSTPVAICETCGSPLPAGTRRGICPRCLLKQAMEPLLPEEVGLKTSPNLTAYPKADGSSVPNTPNTDVFYRSQPNGLPTRNVWDYEVLEQIGRGGMGVIFKARQRSLDRIVALKLIGSGWHARPADIARFRTEAAAAARLQHPHIVAIYEVGEHDGQHFFSMEYVPGHSLAHTLNRGPIEPERAGRLMQTVAEAIHFAHERGVLHRDLKPSNILLDAKEEPRVADFGLAKLLQSDSELTLTGVVMGSPQYMPPEQARGKSAQADRRSDVYSLGAVLYECLTGHPPFRAATAVETLRLVVERSPIPPRQINPALPRDLETICVKCLNKEPEGRYATAQELAEELGRYLQGEPLHARPVGPAEQLWRWCKRKPALAGMAGAMLAVTIAGFAAVTWQWRQARANEQAARLEAAKSQQVIQFLEETLNGAGLSIAAGSDKTIPGEVLATASASLNRSLKDQPYVEAEVRSALGGIYRTLGDNEQAEAMARQALALYRGLYGETHPKVAMALHNLAGALQGQGKLLEAHSQYRQALSMRRKVLGNNDPSVAATLNDLARVLYDQSELAEAETLHRQALGIRRNLPDKAGPEVTQSLANLALILQRGGKRAEAEPLFREALANVRSQSTNNPAKDTSLAGLVLHHLADVLLGRHELEEARALAEEATTLYRRHPVWPSHEYHHALKVLAAIQVAQKDFAGLQAAYAEAVALSKRPVEYEDIHAIIALRSMARVYTQAALLDEARTLYREVGEHYRRAADRGNIEAMSGLAWLLATCDDPAVRDGAAAVTFAEKAAAATKRKDANRLDTLAAAYAEAGQFERAISVQQEAMALLRDEKTKAAFAVRLKQYQAGEPCRD